MGSHGGAEVAYINGLLYFLKYGIHTPIVHVSVQHATPRLSTELLQINLILTTAHPESPAKRGYNKTSTMSSYLIGILAAFASPILHGASNTIDSYLYNGIFHRLTPLIFFSTALNLLFLPLVFIFGWPAFVSANIAIILFGIALIEVLYQYPYFWSLRRTDTSVVAALFSLGKVSVPLFAFFIVGERLAPLQYVGFFVLSASLLLSLESVLYKYVFEQGVSWSSAMVWTMALEFFIAGVMVLTPKNLAEIVALRPKIKQVGLPLTIMQFLSWSGSAGSAYALSLIPVSVVKGIGSTQALFVLVYALFFAKRYPHLFREYIGHDGVRKKIFLFACIIVGVVLTIA